jgi:hypothetical protein
MGMLMGMLMGMAVKKNFEQDFSSLLIAHCPLLEVQP